MPRHREKTVLGPCSGLLDPAHRKDLARRCEPLDPREFFDEPACLTAVEA
jgi:hypothetical protein